MIRDSNGAILVPILIEDSCWNSYHIQSEPTMRILVIEDDRKMATLLREALEKQLHRTVLAFNGIEGLEVAQSHHFEAIVLDAMLPGMDGFSVAHALRKTAVATPILMLTARDATTDVVKGLDSGVDDYLTKPFAFAELFARLRALGRAGAGNKFAGDGFAAVDCADA